MLIKTKTPATPPKKATPVVKPSPTTAPRDSLAERSAELADDLGHLEKQEQRARDEREQARLAALRERARYD